MSGRVIFEREFEMMDNIGLNGSWISVLDSDTNPRLLPSLMIQMGYFLSSLPSGLLLLVYPIAIQSRFLDTKNVDVPRLGLPQQN